MFSALIQRELVVLSCGQPSQSGIDDLSRMNAAGSASTEPGDIFIPQLWSCAGKWFVAAGNCKDVVVTDRSAQAPGTSLIRARYFAKFASTALRQTAFPIPPPAKVAALQFVRTAHEMAWAELKNGDLLDFAENAGFAVFVTGDKNLSYQQNLEGRIFALVVLSTNDWKTIKENPRPVAEAVEKAKPGSFQVVTYEPRPPRPRGPFFTL